MPIPKFKEGDVVWLKEFDNGTEVISRQKAELGEPQIKLNEVMYECIVEPEDDADDGIREITEDQIEGLVEEK